MDLIETPLSTYMLAWFGFMGGIWALFDRAETVAAGDTKTAVSRWLTNLNLTSRLANWPAAFAAIFDHVFGEDHLSWRCFYRSCIASVVSVAIVTLIWGALRPEEIMLLIRSHVLSFELWLFFSFAIAFNVIPDYFSLLESRYVIRWMATRSSILWILVFLIIDFAATLAIFLMVPGVAVVAVIVLAKGFTFSAIEQLLEMFWRGLEQASLHSGGAGFPLGIFFYSTFFTSVWVWLYAVSGTGIRLLGRLGVGISSLKKLLDIEEKPIRSLGFVSMLLVTVVFVVVPFVR